MIVALLVVTSVTLAVVAATGVAIAGSESSNLDLVGVTIGVLVLTLVVGALFVQRAALIWILTMLIALTRLVNARVGDRSEVLVDRFVGRLTAVRLSPVQMLMALTWGLLNLGARLCLPRVQLCRARRRGAVEGIAACLRGGPARREPPDHARRARGG